MPFEPGHKKVGGRKSGVSNKKSVALMEVLHRKAVNPLAKLLDLLPQLDAAKQADVCLALMAYVYPKKKPAEDLPPDEAQFLEILRQRKAEGALKETARILSNSGTNDQRALSAPREDGGEPA